uniref:Uncharacterized protein n=1 Tax=Sphingobacterium sp. (strain 21) TaxID=743722 RepID=F4C9S9_SPHS2
MIGKQLFFEGEALWIYDYEIRAMKYNERFTIRHFSFVPPLSNHKGAIALTEKEILLEGDESVIIPLSSVEQLYYGFDELYTQASVKNFGAFWKPLRIMWRGSYIYFIINYRTFSTSNEKFLTLLKDLLL